MVVGFQQHQMLSRMSVPDKDVATIRAAHHKVITPETGFFNLHTQTATAMYANRCRYKYTQWIFKQWQHRAYHCSRIAVTLVHHLDRWSADVLGLTFFHLTPFLSPAKQLLDASRGGASIHHGKSLMKNCRTIYIQQHLTHINPTAVLQNINLGCTRF